MLPCANAPREALACLRQYSRDSEERDACTEINWLSRVHTSQNFARTEKSGRSYASGSMSLASLKRLEPKDTSEPKAPTMQGRASNSHVSDSQ